MLKLKGQLQSGKRYKDGSVSLGFITHEEISSEAFAEIDRHRMQNGWIVFRENSIDASDIPTSDAEIDGDMPLWKRQQKALYKLFMLQGGKPADFHIFYREQMATFQEVITDKIESLENGRN